jgi:hypothetical protein
MFFPREKPWKYLGSLKMFWSKSRQFVENETGWQAGAASSKH